MISERKDNILCIQQWKARASLINGAISQSWDVTAEDLAEIERPVTFYFCEPLKTGFAAFAVFDRTGFENLVTSGIQKFGTEAEIFAAVTAVTDELIENPTAASPELLDAVVTGNLILFANNITASQIVQEKSYRNFGQIVYKNPKREDDLISFRAMKISEQSPFSEPYNSFISDSQREKNKVVLTVSWYLQHDEPLLPRHFEGVVNVLDAACEFASMHRVDLPILWEN